MQQFYFYLRAIVPIAALFAAGCLPSTVNNPKAVDAGGLALTRAVLYQNGVGYFERKGRVEGDRFTVRIRADQVNDFLKSLTVIDTSNGKAISVSLPLDRSAAAHVMELAQKLKQDIGLPEIISLLKGTEISLAGEGSRSISGRVLSVEELPSYVNEGDDPRIDWRVSVAADNAIQTMLLSAVTALYIEDDFITLGLHKGLDAAATGGVFKVVDVVVHLDRPGDHQILVSYVVECPAWKPTYRLVLGEGEDVLLQGWAVVDNVTGEGWDDISLSLTSGAPLAFRYDLYSPKFVNRPDLSATADQRVARADVGETAYGTTADADEAPAYEEEAAYEGDAKTSVSDDGPSFRGNRSAASSTPAKRPHLSKERSAPPAPPAASVAGMGTGPNTAEPSEISMQSLQDSVQSMVKASSASGAVRYDMTVPVSVPDRSSTLVSILNHKVKGEEVFLFKPGGSGQGYEQNPYRVVRFKNTTGFMLEPGPISIYSGGSFVGEGIAETISDGKQAIIPFAVDASIMVTAEQTGSREGAKLLRIFNRQLWVESFQRIKTVYAVKGGDKTGFRIYVRHPKAGGAYVMKDPPSGTEDVGDATLVPLEMKKGISDVSYTVVEQTPVTQTLTIWDGDALSAVSLILEDVGGLDAKVKASLVKILEIVRKVGEIDIKLSGLERQRWEIDQRMHQTRENLKALKKNKTAQDLKNKLAKSLAELSTEGEGITRSVVSLSDERSALAVSVDQMMGEISFGN